MPNTPGRLTPGRSTNDVFASSHRDAPGTQPSQRGPAQGRPELTQRLADPSADVRAAALRSLRELEPSELIREVPAIVLRNILSAEQLESAEK